MKRRSQIIIELDELIKENESYLGSTRTVLNLILAAELSMKVKAAIVRHTYVNDPYRNELDEASSKYASKSLQGRTNRLFALLGILKVRYMTRLKNIFWPRSTPLTSNLIFESIKPLSFISGKPLSDQSSIFFPPP
ncbi:MAG: hypothetical protein ACFE9L_19675 [Candidatus Hodarchaeota archaeon]